jgi:radical SAM-linked protein
VSGALEQALSEQGGRFHLHLKARLFQLCLQLPNITHIIASRLQRLRFRFAKTGSLGLLSHLDLVRMLERALRRSRLPVSFTGGFHPLPRLQFALALPLGAEAQGEWMDLEMAEWQDPAWVRQRLQAQLTSEFNLQSVVEVPLAGPSLSQELVGASWTLELTPAPTELSLSASQEAAASAPPLAAWQRAAADLLAAPQWIWDDTDKKGRPRQRDLRSVLTWLEVEPQGAAVTIRVGARIDGLGRSLRPEQLQHWFASRLGRPLQMRRFCRDHLELKTAV